MDISIKDEFAPRASQYARGSDVPARDICVEFTGVITPTDALIGVGDARFVRAVS
jgi:hypothetical protein